MKLFFKYIKNPVPFEYTEQFTIKIFFKTIGICYFLFFISSAFLIVFNYLNQLPVYQKPDLNSMGNFLMIIIFGPLFEEILFRLNLKISKLNIAAFVSVLTMLIIKLLFIREIKLQFYLYFGTLLLFALIYYTLNRYDISLNKIESFWKSNFKYIFHLFAISFGMIHLTNFEQISWWMIAITPLLTAPYILMGYILGYIRMKYGFSYSLLIHSFNNLISTMFIMKNGLLAILIIAILLSSYFMIQQLKKLIINSLNK